ncbi:hypothetical protein D9M73_270860 [compost metagenome]
MHGSGGDLPPWHARQAPFQRVGAAIDIAYIPHQPRIFHIVAVEGQAQHGTGQRASALVNGQQFFAVQQLAAGHAVGIENEQLEHFDIGVVRQKFLGLLHTGKLHRALACAVMAHRDRLP